VSVYVLIIDFVLSACRRNVDRNIYCSVFSFSGADITAGPRVDLPPRVHC